MPVASVPGAQLHYDVHGARGPWLVFVHGTAGHALSWWQQVPAFAGSCRCLVLDQRGFGRSAGTEADPARLADDLLAVLDDAGAERAALVGQSLGGWAALGAALRAPARVTHLLLASTLAGLTDETTLAELASRAGGAPPPDVRAALAESFVERARARTFLFERIAAQNPPIAGRLVAALLALRYEPPAGPLPFPVRFVAGDRDRLFSVEMIRRAQGRVPGAELVVVPGAGHSVYWEQPATFNALLAALLGLPPPRDAPV